LEFAAHLPSIPIQPGLHGVSIHPGPKHSTTRWIASITNGHAPIAISLTRSCGPHPGNSSPNAIRHRISVYWAGQFAGTAGHSGKVAFCICLCRWNKTVEGREAKQQEGLKDSVGIWSELGQNSVGYLSF
jgi:hypothetical protein